MARQRSRRLVAVVLLPLLAACAADPGSAPSAPAANAFAGAGWSDPVWLGAVVNSNQRDLGPELSRDGLSLYFNSERSGGFGGMDIYVSHRDCEACSWGAPVNLGTGINSAAVEESPALSADGHLLFFNSTNTANGDADLFVAWRSDVHDDLAWGSPVNLGPVINSSGHDQAPEYSQPGPGPAQLYFVRYPRLYVVPILVTHGGGDGLEVTVLEAPAPVDEINAGGDVWQADLRGDGRELIFWASPTRSGGLTGADLWVSTRQSPVHPWGDPVLIGPPVNTRGADLEADLSFDGRTLIFASAASRGGLGKQDLWISTRTPSGQ